MNLATCNAFNDLCDFGFDFTVVVEADEDG